MEGAEPPGGVPMLFRTVYGPELLAIHSFVSKRGAVTTADLQRWFVQQKVTATEGFNLGEAVAFLLDLRLLNRDHTEPRVLCADLVPDFYLGLLERLNAAREHPEVGAHPLDPWFLGILRHCFVRPNQTYVRRLHEAVNALELPVPCSEEKVNAWRRVLEYIGCGWRVGPDFFASYRPQLVEALLKRWGVEGPLEDFLHFAERYLPTLTGTGDMSDVISRPLQYLETHGRVRLSARGDFAGRAYLGERRVKWITIGG